MKKLTVSSGLKERVEYISHNIPVSTCTSNFNDYYNKSWPIHWHEELEFAVVVSGSAAYTIYEGKNQKQRIELHPGQGLVILPEVLHSAEGLEENTIVEDLIFKSSLFVPELYDKEIKPVLHSGLSSLELDPQYSDHNRILKAIHKIANLDHNAIDFETHTLELIFGMWRFLITITNNISDSSEVKLNIDSRSHRLKQALHYIHTHYDMNIAVIDIAASAGISRTECFRSFKTSLGITPMDYVNNYRLSAAASLLRDTEHKVADISYQCGFNDPTYFSRMFRHKYQLSPSDYRKL